MPVKRLDGREGRPLSRRRGRPLRRRVECCTVQLGPEIQKPFECLEYGPELQGLPIQLEVESVEY